MIKIKTDMFKALLSNAVKVCSFDKMLPLTELIELKIEDNMLFIKTTDNINTLILKQPLEGENDNMRVVVDANLINNLVNKITTEFTELLLTDNTLLITGNGTYNLELRVDESGEIIKFPEVSYDESKANIEFEFEALANKLETCSGAISVDDDLAEMCNYYLKDKVIATNTFKITSIDNIDELKTTELFISRKLGKIIRSLILGKVKFYTEDNKVYFISQSAILSGEINRDLDKYPLQSILSFLDDTYAYHRTIEKGKLLALIDRLTLFVFDYERNELDLTFTKDKLTATNSKQTSNETISYEGEDDLIEFICSVDLKCLKAQVESLNAEKVELYFGSDKTIKFVDGNITAIVATQDEE